MNAVRRQSPANRILRVALLVAPFCGGVARAQPVAGDVKLAGFQGVGTGGFVGRPGQWLPIHVELTAESSEHQQVTLRYEHPDLDGDLVGYQNTNVTLTGGGTVRRTWVYGVADPASISRHHQLDVLDENRIRILSLPVPDVELIDNDTRLFVDISERQLPSLRSFDTGSYVGNQAGARRFYRPICVATLPQAALPDRWFGLEAVDLLIWDEPDPARIEPAQIDAIIEWVRCGGELIIGVGTAGRRLRASPIAALLPFTGNQPALEITVLERFCARFASQPGFPAPITVARGDLADGATAIFSDQVPGSIGVRRINLIAARPFGAGRVIATAARLRDLTGDGVPVSTEPGSAAFQVNASAVWRLMFGVNSVTAAFNKDEAESPIITMGRVETAYESLLGPIEFQRRAGALLLLALTFVGAYVLLSTAVSWFFLRRRGLTHLSWSVFAAFAVVASVLSLAAVRMFRGIGYDIHAVSFVDLEAGSNAGSAWSWFGVKSSDRDPLDLHMPGETAFARPLARATAVSRYATPQRYAALPGAAELRDVPVRATLKQFEGHWSGALPGTVRGQLSASTASGELLPASWIQNDLGVDLLGGYLLYADPRLARTGAEAPYTPVGVDTPAGRPRYWDQSTVPPAINVLSLEIPPLASGARVSSIGADEYEERNEAHTRWMLEEGPPSREPMLPTLWHRQNRDWISSLSTIGGGTLPEPHAAAMLMSTRGLYLHNDSSGNFDNVGVPITTRGMMDVDVTHWLTRDQAVLLLLAAGPGPSVVELDGNARQPEQGFSVYRVRVPLELVRGQP